MKDVLERDRLIAAYQRRPGKTVGPYSFADVAYLFAAQERERLTLRALRRAGALPLTGRDILDVGCGNGRWLRDLVRWGAEPARVTGVDALEDRIVEARTLLPASVTLRHADAGALPFPDASFDIVIQCMMMSSVLDAGIRRRIAAEMVRVLKPGGFILWQDFTINNPRNADVRGVPPRELAVLFPSCRTRLKRVFPPPQLIKMVAPVSWTAAYLMSRLPALCTSRFGTITPQN